MPHKVNGSASPDFYNFFRSPAAEKLHIQFIEWPVPLAGNVYRSNDAPDGTKLYVHIAYDQKDQDYIAQQFWEQRWSRRMIDVALFGVVPCALLYLLGYVLLWVGRVFRST